MIKKKFYQGPNELISTKNRQKEVFSTFISKDEIHLLPVWKASSSSSFLLLLSASRVLSGSHASQKLQIYNKYTQIRTKWSQ